MIVHDAFFVKYLGEVPDVMEWVIRLGLAAAIMLVGWLTARRRAVSQQATAPEGAGVQRDPCFERRLRRNRFGGGSEGARSPLRVT